MSPGRRTIDRRRRVLYSTHQADQTTSTAASRREIERLREARRPTAAYGERVQRRLRGRWFSLVPVRRRTFTILAIVMSVVAFLLCLAHYASVAWPALAYRPEISRPLRLDSPDSFGRWFMIALLSASAGVALMIYQLRRYRLDDYLGRYRLWRLVLIVLVLASINSLVGLLDWTGSILDLTFGKRVALSGGDWLRVVVGLGGAVLALRMLAEVRRSRSSLIAMIAVCGILIIPQAAQWNVLQVDTIAKWTAVTSAPLLASTALFVAMAAYLRMLYREVREIEDGVSLRERLEQVKVRMFTRPEREQSSEEQDASPPEPTRAEKRQAAREARAASQESEKDSSNENEESAEPKRGWFRRRRAAADAAIDSAIDSAADSPREESTGNEPQHTDDSEDAKPKRGWFGRRTPESEGQLVDDANNETEEAPAATKRSRFGLRLKPRVLETPSLEVDSPSEGAEEVEAADEPAAKRSSGLGGWFGRRKAADDGDQNDSNESDGANAASKQASSNQSSGGDDGEGNNEYIDPDSIDWNGLNKADRRRLKKQLRRQDRAA